MTQKNNAIALPKENGGYAFGGKILLEVVCNETHIFYSLQNQMSIVEPIVTIKVHVGVTGFVERFGNDLKFSFSKNEVTWPIEVKSKTLMLLEYEIHSVLKKNNEKAKGVYLVLIPCQKGVNVKICVKNKDEEVHLSTLAEQVVLGKLFKNINIQEKQFIYQFKRIVERSFPKNK